MAEASPTNRLQLTAQHVDDLVAPGRLRYGLWQVPAIDMTTYGRYTVTEADLLRIDLIAHRALGSTRLWWAIAIVNNIANPFTDLAVGMVLKIPRMDAISIALAERIVEVSA